MTNADKMLKISKEEFMKEFTEYANKSIYSGGGVAIWAIEIFLEKEVEQDD